MSYCVIVPVHDEETVLGRLVDRLSDGLHPDAEVIFVCNGCTDGSAGLLRSLAPWSRILEMPEAGKAAAIRAGEAATARFPRFYVDADVEITGAGLSGLHDVLIAGKADLVSPAIRIDTTGVSASVRAVLGIWAALPFFARHGFHCVIGVSQAGRANWGVFPDVMADDAFIAAQIAPDRRRIVRDVQATLHPPRTLAAWIRVRARWFRGNWQLAQRFPDRKAPDHANGQVIRSFLIDPRTTWPAVLYLLARAAAVALALVPQGSPGWYKDRTSRVPATGKTRR